jgi:NitT/TauT family transport system ATP-binding protein
MENTSSYKNKTILELVNITKAIKKPNGAFSTIIEDVSLKLRGREIVGLLGRSGAGKSTLLRMISGLTPHTNGKIKYMGKEVNGPRDWLSMVFQSFALFPWLTVLENVAIGLEAKGLPDKEVYKRSIEAIDLIGLDGYESAYPKELSGGMKQRVGFARALVVNPQVLLLDEPFSALDILTAAALRTEFIDLWMATKIWLQSILLVTHNIEEAVLLCDRILILSSAPGKIISEVEVKIPHPRSRYDVAVKELVDEIYVKLTSALPDKQANALVQLQSITSPLPVVSTNKLNGFIETLFELPFMGKADLPNIAELLKQTVDNLFPILELAQILKFALVDKGDVSLTASGKVYAEADIDGRKKIFARHLIENVPLASHILYKLRTAHNKKCHFNDELEELSKTLDGELAEKLLRVIINYGRYAELFSFNYSTKLFYLEE